MIEPNQSLAAIGQLPDCELDLANAALQLARSGVPHANWERAASHLSDLAREAALIGRVVGDRPLADKLDALTGLIHIKHGYSGDSETYDDLANADLVRVTERKRGLPVALGIVWLHCIRAAGWHGVGIDAPRHFVIRLDVQSDPSAGQLVDVFAGGRAITADASLRRRSTDDAAIRPSLRPMGNREILLRLSRNILERRRAAGEWEEALLVLGRMAAIAPNEALLWADQATLLRRLGRLQAAIDCLERFIALVPSGMAADRARNGIDVMRRHLA